MKEDVIIEETRQWKLLRDETQLSVKKWSGIETYKQSCSFTGGGITSGCGGCSTYNVSWPSFSSHFFYVHLNAISFCPFF